MRTRGNCGRCSYGGRKRKRCNCQASTVKVNTDVCLDAPLAEQVGGYSGVENSAKSGYVNSDDIGSPEVEAVEYRTPEEMELCT